MTELADPRASQVVLIGASAYRHLDVLPSVRDNVTGLSAVLRDVDHWGVPRDNCHEIVDSAEPAAVGRTLRVAAAATGPDGLFLVYYAGHGLIKPEDGSLVLALHDAEPEVPDEAGLPYEWVGRVMRSAHARRRVVILDCCYAGRATAELAAQTTATGVVADKAEIEETCLLVSARRNRTAAAPAGQRYTAFTEELLKVLESGLTGGGAFLTIESIWREVRRSLLAKGHELPELRERNAGGSISLVRNAATRHRDLAGSILVASRGVVDSDLHESAVLIVRHNETGAIGVRLTRPTSGLPAEFSAAWRPLLTEPPVVFDGGPVARDGYIAMALLRPHATAPLRFSPLRNRLGTLSLVSAPEGLRHTFSGMRIFSGYLGWGPGELEAYLDSGLLIFSDYSVGAALSTRPRELWPLKPGSHP